MQSQVYKGKYTMRISRITGKSGKEVTLGQRGGNIEVSWDLFLKVFHMMIFVSLMVLDCYD